MGIRVCESTANDSCRSGKLFCQVSAVLKGGFDATQEGTCQIKCSYLGVTVVTFWRWISERSEEQHLCPLNSGPTLWFACSRVELAQPQGSAVIKMSCPILGVFCSQGSLCCCEVAGERILHTLFSLEVVCFGDVYVSAIILAIKLQPWKCFHLGWFHLFVATAMQRSVMGNALLDL